MDKLKQWVTIAVLASVVLLAAGWFLLISPKKGEAADLRTEAAAQVSANAVLETQLSVLRTQAKELPKKQSELAAVAAKIPDNPSLPALIRALTEASTSAGVDFVSVTPGQPVLPVAAPVQATAPEPATAQTTPQVPVAPVAGGAAGGLATIPLAINVVGDYFDIAQFTNNLENLPRAMRVMDLTLAPGTSPTAPKTSTATADDGRSLSTTLNGSVFMAVNRPAATPVVAPPAVPAK